MMEKLIAAAVVSLCMLSSGCNTIHGMGQDIKSAGHAIEKAADK